MSLHSTINLIGISIIHHLPPIPLGWGCPQKISAQTKVCDIITTHHSSIHSIGKLNLTHCRRDSNTGKGWGYVCFDSQKRTVTILVPRQDLQGTRNL